QAAIGRRCQTHGSGASVPRRRAESITIPKDCTGMGTRCVWHAAVQNRCLLTVAYPKRSNVVRSTRSFGAARKSLLVQAALIGGQSRKQSPLVINSVPTFLRFS